MTCVFKEGCVKIPRATKKILALQSQVIEDFTKQIPQDLWDVRRGPEVWTLREHLYHLADVQKLLLGRIKLILAEERPVIQPYFPDNEPALAELFPSIGAALTTYRRLRDKQLKLFAKARKSDWKKQALHGEYRLYSLSIIARHLVIHDDWHLYRMEEIWLTKDEYFH